MPPGVRDNIHSAESAMRQQHTPGALAVHCSLSSMVRTSLASASRETSESLPPSAADITARIRQRRAREAEESKTPQKGRTRGPPARQTRAAVVEAPEACWRREAKVEPTVLEPIDIRTVSGMDNWLLNTPEEVHENILRRLEPRHRGILMQAASALWKAGLTSEVFHSNAVIAGLQQQYFSAREHGEELSEEDFQLLRSVMRLACDAVQRLPITDFESVAAASAPSALIRLAEEAVCTVLRCDPVKVWGRNIKWSIDSPPPEATEWHLTFKALVALEPALAQRIVDCDLVDLGMNHGEDIKRITQKFADFVSQDEFVIDDMNPLTHWATVILLWLRKVDQCCTAAGTSLSVTHASRALRKARSRATYWSARKRWHSNHESRRDAERHEQILKTVAFEQSARMAELASRSKHHVYNTNGDAIEAWSGLNKQQQKQQQPDWLDSSRASQHVAEEMSYRLGSTLPQASSAAKRRLSIPKLTEVKPSESSQPASCFSTSRTSKAPRTPRFALLTPG